MNYASHYGRVLRYHALSGDRLVEVPAVRQRNDFECGAAATASVGWYFGVGPESLSQWATDLGTTKEHSTRPSAIIDQLRSLGLTVTASDGLSITDLAAYTAAGSPVLCPVQDYGSGHWLVVIGVGFSGDYVVCQDPGVKPDADSIQQPGRVLVATADWLRRWHDEDIDGNSYHRFGIAVQGRQK